MSSTKVGGFRDLVVVNADGSARMRVTEDLAVSKPAWSPNGRKIAITDNDFYYGRYVVVLSPDGISSVTYVVSGYDGTWRP